MRAIRIGELSWKGTSRYEPKAFARKSSWNGEGNRMLSEVPKILEKQFVVTELEAIQFMGPEVPHVLSTPSLVNWMELTSREHVAPLLNPGEDTVGISMNIEHLAPTPVGMGVRVVSTLANAGGRVFAFEIEAFDEVDKIGKATHQRASVVVAKFAGRIAAKKEKAARGR